MTIKQLGGVFGRNPTFNDVTIEGTLTFDGDIDITSDLTVDGDLTVNGNSLFDFTTGTGKLTVRGVSGTYAVNYHAGENGLGYHVFSTRFGGADVDRMLIKNNGDISFYDTSASQALFWDASAESLGIGTTTPSAKLNVRDGNLTVARDGSDTQIRAVGFGAASLDAVISLSGTASNSAAADSEIRAIGGSGTGGILTFRTDTSGGAMTERVRIDSSGNLLLGGQLTPTSSAGNIVLTNGTAPTASAADSIVLYAEDVSASSELKVRDEAGNVTTLSPHNFALIPQGPSEDMAWSYYSERDGKSINVDMLKAIRVLEKLSGEQLVFES